MNFFNEKKFIFITKKYKSIFDYGCGEGTLNLTKKKVYLYDKNRKVYKKLKKKYNKKNNFIILKDCNFKKADILLINSVFQYLDKKAILNLKKNFFKYKKIIISDIPKYPRIIEAVILLFYNPYRLCCGLNNFFFKKLGYTKMKFNYYSSNKIIKIFKKYDLKICNSLNYSKFTRYSIIINNEYPAIHSN